MNAAATIMPLIWKFEHDIQGAFTIASFALTSFATGVAAFQTWQNII